MKRIICVFLTIVLFATLSAYGFAESEERLSADRKNSNDPAFSLRDSAVRMEPDSDLSGAGHVTGYIVKFHTVSRVSGYADLRPIH